MIEYACAALYATPAAVGFLLIPAVYMACAIYNRSRRIVIQEPQLSLTLREFEDKARAHGVPRAPARSYALRAVPRRPTRSHAVPRSATRSRMVPSHQVKWAL